VGVVFQTLVSVVGLDPAYLAPAAALMLGVAILACGLGAALLLKQGKKWPIVLGLGLLMGIVQYFLAVTELRALAVFVAGLAGMAGGILIGRLANKKVPQASTSDTSQPGGSKNILTGALASYGLLTLLLTVTALVKPLNQILSGIVWQLNYPEVATAQSFITPAGHGTIVRPLLHPGTYIFLTACVTIFGYWRLKFNQADSWKLALSRTVRSAAPASIGVISMVCLSTLMDHSGMTMLLAQGLSAIMGAAFPLVSPFIGILGAFATGSNNNSNVLFAPLQKNAALILGLDPRLLLAAQTTGGALGSMLAPAKLIVGCSTTGLKGRDGEVLRHTLVYGLLISLGLGILSLVISIL
jgi:lactate permease